MRVLDLVDVNKVYRGPTEIIPAVAGVSLTIDTGEVVVLYGPSGSGKSTLLLLAAGVIAPDSGSVLGEGRDLAGLSEDDRALRLRHEVGIAYQNPHFMPGLPAVDVAGMKLLGGRASRADARRAAVPCLIQVGLGERLQHTPEQLSGGERQRVALARALVGEPSLLLLDEPTGNLDSQRGGEIFDLISNVARGGAGVLLVTHDPQAARIAHRVYELRDGQLHTPGLAATG